MNIVRAMNEIGERLKRFPCYIQFDMMDCGPAALASIASYYGKEYGIPELRGYCFLTKDGVSLLGIEDAARNIGFETLAVKTSVPKLYSKKPFPCILHWDNVHFVVLYNIRKSIVTGQRFFYMRVCHKSMAHPLLCYLLYNPRSIVAYSKKGII